MFTCVSFPAKSFIVIVSFVFSIYSFVNVFLSLDKSQPSISCTSSFDVIVTVTLSLVISFVLYPTFAIGTVLSILFISIFTCVSFPAKSFIVIFSFAFLLYSFVNTFLSDDNVQPAISCICSSEFIVAVTFLFVGFFELYTISTFAPVLSNTSGPSLEIVTFSTLSFAKIHKYHSPSPVVFSILDPFVNFSKNSFSNGSASPCTHLYFSSSVFSPVPSSCAVTLQVCCLLGIVFPVVSNVIVGGIATYFISLSMASCSTKLPFLQ